MSFVFYDTETTGKNWQFDQILQLAAVRTNSELEPIDEVQFESRILPHVVPHPEALAVNGFTFERLTSRGLPSHYDMARAIRAKFQMWGKSMFMGFNSIRFDEQILRAAFYKTLHRPYLTVMDGNSRSDILLLARAADLLAPGVLKIPVSNDGSPTFRLESLSVENGYNLGKAHEARGDVGATLHLARILQNEASSVWNNFMRFAQKSNVLQFIQDESIFGLADYFKGTPYSWLVTRLGVSTKDKNVHYVFDLQIDPGEIAGLNAGDLANRLIEFPRPLKKLKVNLCPIIFAVEEAPTGTKALKIGDAELERRVKRLRGDRELVSRLLGAMEILAPVYPPSPYVEQQIFDTFTPDSDLIIADQFHESSWPERLHILNALQDPRLRVLGEELIYFDHPNLLAREQRAVHAERHRRKVLGLDGDVPWLTIPSAVDILRTALSSCEAGERSRLNAQWSHLEQWRDSIS